MLNKQNTTSTTKTKEEKEQKQFGKVADKGESSSFKPSDTKTQQKKADTAAKPHGKECSMEEDEEECDDE